MKHFARPVAVLACSSALLSPMTLSSSASATSSHPAHPSAHSRVVRCTVSAVDRAAVRDQLTHLYAQLRGTRPTRTGLKALRAAIAELRTAALDANMSAAVRVAKAAELARLRAVLRTTTSATARIAIRAQLTAIRVELQAARLTRTQRVAIRVQASALRRASWSRPTVAQAKVLRAEAARLQALLRCHTALTSVPPVTGV